MKDFEDWAKTIPKWSGTLLDLGASWDTFRREPDEVISDLVQGGIPLLSAKDIVDKARQVLQRKSAPLAVFWDLDTIGIPRGTNGRDVIIRLKQELSSWGHVAQLRGYASNTLSLIPEQYRSDMIESGFVLIDSPQGGKEVATKRMIIDAMVFAYESVSSAVSICLISADTDLAHLLSALEGPKRSTIFVSNTSTLKRMADVTCDLKLHWESDILQLPAQYDDFPERGRSPRAIERERYPRDGGRSSPTDELAFSIAKELPVGGSVNRGSGSGGGVHGEEWDYQVRTVVSVMEMLLESDELYVNETVLQFQLAVRERANPKEERQNYSSWIDKAIRYGAVLLFSRPGVPKGRFYCLPDQLENSRAACSQTEINSFDEEKHILNLITNNPAGDRWLSRKYVMDSLKAAYPRMKSPALRVKVFLNGARKGLFFVGKDGPTQVVARTKEEAQAALSIARQRNLGYSHDSSHSSKRLRSNVGSEYEGDDPYASRRSREDDEIHRDEKRYRDGESDYRRQDSL